MSTKNINYKSFDVSAEYEILQKEECAQTLSSSTISVEDFTSQSIGAFGKWQCQISLLMALLKFPIAWFQLGIIFLAPQQEFWCEKPSTFTHLTDSEWRKMCKPDDELHPCLIYDPEILVNNIYANRSTIPLVPCTKFVYDTKLFKSTIISEWDLVCNRQQYIELSQFVLMGGVLVGNVIFGILADKFGRRKPLMAAILLQAVTSIISTFIPWFCGFVLNRFFIALATGGIGLISFVMCMEIVSGYYRTTIPILYQIPFGIGNTIMAALAYCLREWRSLELALAIMSSIYLIYFWLVPESPRWLLATGQTEEAIVLLKKAAMVNGKVFEVTSETTRLLQVESKRHQYRPGFAEFFHSKNLRLKTLLLCFNWFCAGLSFFSFSQYLGQVARNIFLTIALGGLISSPGALLCVLMVNSLGRKSAISGFQILTAVCFLLILVVPRDMFHNDYPRMFFAGLGLLGMSVSVPALYLYTGELFPTVGRNVGVGGVSMFSRIGSMVAPLIVTLDRVATPLPLLLLSFCSVMQAIMIQPLPETKGCPLPDTIEQAEMFDREYSSNYREERRKRRLRQSRKS